MNMHPQTKQAVLFALILGISSVVASQLSGCGTTGDQGPQGTPGVGYQAPTVSSTQQQIDDVVANENSWRESQGESYLTSGLSCTVQAVSSGGFLSTSSPNYVAANCTAAPLSAACPLVVSGTSYPYLLTTAFDQPNKSSGTNNVIATGLQQLFEANNYKIVCTGQLVVTTDTYHSFTMSSDDGSILTIDGTIVIANDGQHGITTAVGGKDLRSDVVHTFSLQYSQSGGGAFALVLDMDGDLLPAANLYH